MEKKEVVFYLKRGQEKHLRFRHPWVYANQVERVEGRVAIGNLGEVRSAAGKFLGRGVVNPRSKILIRILSWSPQEAVEENLFRKRLREALALRRRFFPEAWEKNRLSPKAALRLVFAEADGLPGLVVDAFGPLAVFSCTSAGMRPFQETWVEELKAFGFEYIYEKSQGEVLEREGLLPVQKWWSAPLERPLVFEEGPARFFWNAAGQKTGFYLDARNIRKAFAARGRGGKLLDAFASSGAAAVCAALSGAQSVVAWEASRACLKEAARHAEANGVADRVFFEQRDTFRDLPRLAQEAPGGFDGVLLDPPPLARSVHETKTAQGVLKKIWKAALELVRPGGFAVFTACSHVLNWNVLERILSQVTGEGLDAFIEERLSQPLDHPILPHVPETEYLRGIVVRRKV